MITKEAIEAAHSSADIIRQINEAEPADDWLDRAAAFAAMPGPAVLVKALEDMEEVRKAVFGDVGDEPDVYADYDRCSELSGKMRQAIEELRHPIKPAPDLASENERLRAALGAMKTPTVWTVEFTTPEDDEGETASFAFADKGEFEKFTSAMHGRVISIFERDCVTAEDAIDRAALERT